MSSITYGNCITPPPLSARCRLVPAGRPSDPDPNPSFRKNPVTEERGNKVVGLFGGRSPETLLAVDPGRAKCGLAVVAGPEAPRCLERAVVETERLTLAVAEILRRRPEIGRLLIGDATHSATLRRALGEMFPQIPLLTVNEHGTSARARARFLQENPPRGWRRLLLPGLRSPETPYDDYAALLLAEDYFSKKLDI